MTEPVKFSVYIATSVDGFIARPDGDVAWLDETEPLGDGEDAGFGAFFGSVDVLVMGRGTFEKVLEFDWPYGDKPVMVLSRTLQSVPEARRETVTIERSAPHELSEKLTQAGYKRAYLDGGKVIQSFLRAGLVDEMTITLIPVLLGEGIPLFGPTERDIPLQLLSSQSWPNGFVQNHYRVTG